MFANDPNSKNARPSAPVRGQAAAADQQASSPLGIARCLEMLATEADLLHLPTTALLIGAASLSAIEEAPQGR